MRPLSRESSSAIFPDSFFSSAQNRIRHSVLCWSNRSCLIVVLIMNRSVVGWFDYKARWRVYRLGTAQSIEKFWEGRAMKKTFSKHFPRLLVAVFFLSVDCFGQRSLKPSLLLNIWLRHQIAALPISPLMMKVTCDSPRWATTLREGFRARPGNWFPDASDSE